MLGAEVLARRCNTVEGIGDQPTRTMFSRLDVVHQFRRLSNCVGLGNIYSAAGGPNRERAPMCGEAVAVLLDGGR